MRVGELEGCRSEGKPLLCLTVCCVDHSLNQPRLQYLSYPYVLHLVIPDRIVELIAGKHFELVLSDAVPSMGVGSSCDECSLLSDTLAR